MSNSIRINRSAKNGIDIFITLPDAGAELTIHRQNGAGEANLAWTDDKLHRRITDNGLYRRLVAQVTCDVEYNEYGRIKDDVAQLRDFLVTAGLSDEGTVLRRGDVVEVDGERVMVMALARESDFVCVLTQDGEVQLVKGYECKQTGDHSDVIAYAMDELATM